MKSAQLSFSLVLFAGAALLVSCATQPKIEKIQPDPKEVAAQHAIDWQDKNKSGLAKLGANDLDGAEKDLVAGLKDAELCGKDDPRVAVSLNNLASLYENKKMYSQCASYLREARKIFRKWYGNDSESIFVTERNEARVLTKQNKWAESLPLYEDAIKGMKAHHSNDLNDVEKEYAEAQTHTVKVKTDDTAKPKPHAK